eukprot:15089248-Alexandrium_andersonii.AAC.1
MRRRDRELSARITKGTSHKARPPVAEGASAGKWDNLQPKEWTRGKHAATTPLVPHARVEP